MDGCVYLRASLRSRCQERTLRTLTLRSRRRLSGLNGLLDRSGHGLGLQGLVALEVAFVDVDTGTSSGSLHVSYQSVSSGKLSSALFTVVGLFSGVQLDMPLQVVQPSELGVAGFAGERLLM